MAGDPKRLRWTSVWHRGGVTLRGLQDILDKVPDDSRVGRNTIRAANAMMLDQVRHTEVFPLIGGGEFTWEIANPNLLLPEFLRISPTLQDVYGDALRAIPNDREHPWTVLVTWDEFPPSDQYKPKKPQEDNGIVF